MGSLSRLFSKRACVVTHSGNFHPDDVCAVAVLHLVLGGKYRLVRTRDPRLINTADYVVDVGDVYDPSRQRFDHHQKDGAGVRQTGTPYASFGLVWKEYGAELCGSAKIAEDMDRAIVAYADALDNGVNLLTIPEKSESPHLFEDFLFSLNPLRTETQDFDGAFKEAVSYAVVMLRREIAKRVQKAGDRTAVEEAYQAAPDKRIIELSEPYSWTETLVSHPEPLFVVRPNPDGTWVAKAVPVAKGSFQSRHVFPVAWAGLKDQEFARVSGVIDARFCHNARFIAVAGSREGILALVRKALEE